MVVKTYCIQYKEQASFVLVDVRTVNRASSDVFVQDGKKGALSDFDYLIFNWLRDFILFFFTDMVHFSIFQVGFNDSILRCVYALISFI